MNQTKASLLGAPAGVYYVLYRGPNRQWYWSLRSANHRVIADGAEGYKRRIDAAAGVDLVKGSMDAPVFSGRKLVQA